MQMYDACDRHSSCAAIISTEVGFREQCLVQRCAQNKPLFLLAFVFFHPGSAWNSALLMPNSDAKSASERCCSRVAILMPRDAQASLSLSISRGWKPLRSDAGVGNAGEAWAAALGAALDDAELPLWLTICDVEPADTDAAAGPAAFRRANWGLKTDAPTSSPPLRIHAVISRTKRLTSRFTSLTCLGIYIKLILY